jgi:Mrp family chromosome partitioning ATPase
VEQEGKSTTVANLAVAYAQVGKRVVLVDLDLRRPYLDRFFGLQGRPGLTDVALGHVPLDDALVKIAVTGASGADGAENGNGNGHQERMVEGVLEVLPAGTLPPDPTMLIESPALGEILESLSQRADIVLIDAAPVLPVSDAMQMSARVGGAIIIVRGDMIRRPILKEMARELEKSQCPLLGFALTGAESDQSYGYGYGYGYGYAPTEGRRAKEKEPVK